jgi:hypothetical protein
MTTQVKRGRGRPKMIKEVSLASMKQNEDWANIFANTINVSIQDVDKISACAEPNDDHGFLALGKLKDGRWFAFNDGLSSSVGISRKFVLDEAFPGSTREMLNEPVGQ